MLLNKSHYNIKSNNYFESLNNFENPTKSLDTPHNGPIK